MARDKLQEPDNKPLPLLKLAHLQDVLNSMRNNYGKLETLVESVQKNILDIQQDKTTKTDIIEQRVNAVREAADKKAVETLRALLQSRDLLAANEHWWTRQGVMQRARFFSPPPSTEYTRSEWELRTIAVETAEDTRHLRVMEELARTPSIKLAERAREAVELEAVALAHHIHLETHSRRYADTNEKARTVNAVSAALQGLQLAELQQAEALIEEASALLDRAKNRYAEVFKGRYSPMNKIKQGLRARQQQAAANVGAA